MTTASELRVVLDDLITGNHILAHHGVVDCYGHLSARDPREPEHFLLAWAVAPALVTEDDILTFDLNGDRIGEDDRELYSERFLHAAIYAARPDVHGIVHSHSAAVIPFAIVADEPLRPVWHVSSFLNDGAPVFDTMAVAGDTDLLIKNMTLGRSLAETLGSSSVVLMRGHGSSVIGRSAREAVYRAIYTEQNARIQSEASRFGKPIQFLSPGEALLMDKYMKPDVRRPWDFWRREVETARALEALVVRN